MSESALSEKKLLSLKRCWKVGNNTIIVIDKALVSALGIVEENTIFQEELTDGGILIRLINKSSGAEQTSEEARTDVTTFGTSKNGNKR